MPVEIFALKCPCCGNASNVASPDAGFGRNFTCGFCATTSIVIVNRQLFVPQHNERVCLACGAVASSAARFCQCGASLTQECFNCRSEMSTAHLICEKCGWRQDIQPNTPEGLEFTAKSARANLASRDLRKVTNALHALVDNGISAPDAIPTLIGYLETYRAHHTEIAVLACQVLGSMGALASSAIPALAKSAEWNLSAYCNRRCKSIHCMLGPGNYFGEVYDYSAHHAVGALVNIGPETLPWLLPLLGIDFNIQMCCDIQRLGTHTIPAMIKVLENNFGLSDDFFFEFDEVTAKRQASRLNAKLILTKEMALPELRRLASKTGVFSSERDRYMAKSANEIIRHIVPTQSDLIGKVFADGL
jgi:hypothetical protein